MYITRFLAWLHVTYRHLKPQWCDFNHGSWMSRTGTNFHLLGGHWTMKLWKRVLRKIYLTLSNFIPHGIHLIGLMMLMNVSLEVEVKKSGKWWAGQRGNICWRIKLSYVVKYSLITIITTTCKQLAMTRAHNDCTYTDKVYVTKFLDEGRYLSLHQIITAPG